MAEIGERERNLCSLRRNTALPAPLNLLGKRSLIFEKSLLVLQLLVFDLVQKANRFGRVAVRVCFLCCLTASLDVRRQIGWLVERVDMSASGLPVLCQLEEGRGILIGGISSR